MYVAVRFWSGLVARVLRPRDQKVMLTATDPGGSSSADGAWPKAVRPFATVAQGPSGPTERISR